MPTSTARATKKLPPAGAPVAGTESSPASVRVAPPRSIRNSASAVTPGAPAVPGEKALERRNAIAVSSASAPAGTEKLASPDVTVTAALPPAARASSRPERMRRWTRPSSSSVSAKRRDGTIGSSAPRVDTPAAGATTPSTSAR